MSTTVRIREEDKQKLDRLQAQITLETGNRPPLEEVLHRLVRLGERKRADLLEQSEVSTLSEEQKQQVLAATHDLGFETGEEDIDDVLYGGPEGPA